MKRITTTGDLDRALDGLCAAHPAFAAIRTAAGEVPLRLSPPGFASLAWIVTSQQVSRASATAIHARLVDLVQPLDAAALLLAGEDGLRRAGLSRPKQRCLLALAAAVEGGLDLDALCALDAEAASARLLAVPGIGPWTADVYLLACAGHPDVFPARDVALQNAIAHAFGLVHRPDHRATASMAESWAPWRAAAARLLWAYYATQLGRTVAPNPGPRPNS
jgi:DNA-3-methyladenine glycosylase II